MEPRDLYRCPPQLFEPNSHWKVFFACKRGRSHIAGGKVCQDYCVAERISEEIFIVAAADGHGGEDYVKSDVGSKEACNAVVSLAKKYSEPDDRIFADKLTAPEFKRELFDTWQTAVPEDYRAENPDAKENVRDIIRKYGTTLLFAVVTKNYFILGQIGDGAILFFNDQNQSQLFKRHNPKRDSKTSSLASGRGLFSLIVESYRRRDFKFNKILLSTDGIYDKLDRGDSFMRYANELAAQIQEKPAEEIQPFTVAEIDVSEKSHDDCTTAAIISPPTEEKYELPPQADLQDLNDLKFERAFNGMEIYSASKDSTPLELHVSKRLYHENYSFDALGGKFKLLKLLKSLPKDLRTKVNIFELPEGLFRVCELIEHGEHLEKKYFSNDDAPQIFTNEFWLSFYEDIRELKKFFREKEYFAQENLFKTMMISECGEIFLFADCLSKDGYTFLSNQKFFKTAESFFGFLGKLKCGEKVLPLFKCPKYSVGQIVPELHTSAGKPFCQIVFNPQTNAYGLKNLSGKIWLIEQIQVRPKQSFPLSKDYVIELEDGVKYKLELFSTEE